VAKENLKVEYQTNLLRIIPHEGINLGRMTDTDDVHFYKYTLFPFLLTGIIMINLKKNL